MSGFSKPAPVRLDDCGCCAGTSVLTPVEIRNRPGLSAIAYRVGTHARFKQSMLTRLSSPDRAVLAGLETRDDDDFAIALLDAWATVSDVLTFYQERIANECYFRTATERRSVIELARLIGYQLAPGVAASAYLAFTLEDALAAPGQGTTQTVVEVGTRVQSIPGPGEKPQTFETIRPIEARIAWNAIRPRLTRRHPVAGNTTAPLYFEGLATGLKSGDGLLLSPDDDGKAMFRQVAKVTVQSESRRTEVILEAPPDLKPTPPGLGLVGFRSEMLSVVTAGYVNRPISTANFRAEAVMVRFRTEDVFANLAAASPLPPGVRAFRTRAAIFGHNAPRWESLPASQRFGEWVQGDPDAHFETGAFSGRKTKWAEGTLNPYGDEAANERYVFLDQSYPAIVGNSEVVLKADGTSTAYTVEDVSDVSRADFAISAKVTRLHLNTATDLFNFGIRNTTVFAQPETLALARMPIEDPVSGTSIELDGWIDGLFAGQVLIICGELHTMRGVRACEALHITAVEHQIEVDGGTRIEMASLANAYIRQTVTIFGNVAVATHGETVEEVLGGGDASQAHQRFTLRQPPVTHVRASTPSGAESTLEVRVNDIRWHETPSLFGHGPRDRVFTTRLEDDGTTFVQFGDNVEAARVATGRQNVRAKYRRGIGLDGQVKAGQLSMLLTRPLGLKGVVNPMDAEGAADRETLGDARDHAPLTVLTLGRAVSLKDYEDFARGFSGIAKALATWLWEGRQRTIQLTIAGERGAPVESASETHTHLLAALATAGDPFVTLRVASYQPALFRLSARIRIDPDRQTRTVLTAVEAALRDRFGFRARAFGQPVVLSEVIAAMHAEAGVLAVDVDALHRTDAPQTSPAPRLLAAMPAITAGVVKPAELLTLDPGPLKLEVMS